MRNATTIPETGNGRRAPEDAPPSPAWEAEVYVLRGEDRAGLVRRVRSFVDDLGRQPEVSPGELAFTLNSDLPAGGSRLAVVAGSVSELRSRLTRVAARLDDASCRQINDRQGTYYFEKPLHPEGKLAVLFTGEGSQYLDMVRDLHAHFPEVAEHFALCDRVSLEVGGRVQPITRAFLPPTGTGADERAAAEKELWRLDNAVCSVLMCNWSIYQVLRRLGLEADAFAGHSGGEISALAGAGCIDADEFLHEQLFALSQLLRSQEDDGQIAETILLAAATGRQIADELCARYGPTVHVAMDNCPHQTVVAGPAEVMAGVEAELRARGVICERLPFRRPYHTPLFEPLLGPIARMFEALPLRSPRRPIYSCMTALPFPPDPVEIRRLAVAHWAGRVEFARLIQTMYDDGVRIFVESGPRGNLTAFVEDILRGRPCLAVAADTPRRSGLTQLNHLAGLLAAHNVPLRLERLYEHRVKRLEIRGQKSEVRGQKSEVRGQKPTASTPEPSRAVPVKRSARTTTMVQYFGVMEQFLDVQREVTEQFLQGRRHRPAPATVSVVSSAPRFPLLGDVVRHEPRRELLMRRRVDLTEDRYALDHTLGGREASTLDPDHHGLPVMPMAFSVEMMTEAAAFLVPGKRVIGLQRVRLHRWIPLDADDPITLEVCARVMPGEGSRVQVEIRDLGNGTSWVRDGEALAVDGTVLLGDRYPEPPPVDGFPLTNERPCTFTPAQLYDEERRLFHGPLFQAVCSTDRQGDEGIEGHLRTLPHTGLFRSTPAPDLLTDPLLIDASTHLLGCWHLGIADQTGRVVFPYELGTVQFYGPRPATGTPIKCRVLIERSSARQVSHRIDLIAPEGRLWCRLHPAEYWRFYWPPEYTAYFRRKADVLLGQPWPTVQAMGCKESCCLRIVPPADLAQPVKRGALAHISLSRAEWQQFRTFRGTDARKTEWLFGRIVAKDAVRLLWHQRYGERLRPADMEIVPNAHGRPMARRLGMPGVEDLPAISISHSGGILTALAAFDCSPGIDLERVQPRGDGFEQLAFDPTERALLDCLGPDRDEAIARLWCAREAVAKALGRGQVEGPRSLAVREVDPQTGAIRVVLGTLLAGEFPHLADRPLSAQTYRDGEHIVAVSFLERTEP